MLNQTIRRTVRDAMIDIMSKSDDWDDRIWNDQSGETLSRFGRRIHYSNTSQMDDEYVKFTTEAEAIAEFDRRRFPATGDSVIYENLSARQGYRYMVFLNDGMAYSDENATDDLDEAKWMLAEMMVDAGEFPAAWFVSDYGTYTAIDAEIRAYHNEAGDGMRGLA